MTAQGWTNDNLLDPEPQEVEAERDAWLEWSALAEPGDRAAGWLVGQEGPQGALRLLDLVVGDPFSVARHLSEKADPHTVDEVIKASERWLRRRQESTAEQLKERAYLCGARPVVPGDADWPHAFDDLGVVRPMALWVRGTQPLNELLGNAIAIVGARSSTAYGEHVASTMSAELTDRGWVVVSGGAYGIDAAAHRGALATGGPTVAIMAGGVDRLYPAGNQDLLERIIETGAVLSEAPPGWAPHRSRFLLRNRLIACAKATVVVEAAHRSGALNTVTHAHSLVRPVGVVPGPVTSASSAGCHRLARDGAAVVVTSAADVVELAGPIEVRSDENGLTGLDTKISAGVARGGAIDFAAPHDRAVYDACGRKSRGVDELARTAGLTHAEVRAALGRLELAGVMAMQGGKWIRKR